jgi:hypothetical protein
MSRFDRAVRGGRTVRRALACAFLTFGMDCGSLLLPTALGGTRLFSLTRLASGLPRMLLHGLVAGRALLRRLIAARTLLHGLVGVRDGRRPHLLRLRYSWRDDMGRRRNMGRRRDVRRWWRGRRALLVIRPGGRGHKP